MDVVYLVRPGDDNEELRYSLRSLAHLPHDDVWIVGHRPAWIDPDSVRFAPGNPTPLKHRNVAANILIACEQLPDRNVIVMNDDMFVMRPVDEIAPWARGPLHAHYDELAKHTGWWARSLANTITYLEQRCAKVDPLSFELHIPFVMNTTRMHEVLSDAVAMFPDDPPQWRTVYGALTFDDPPIHPDVAVKSMRAKWPTACSTHAVCPFVSTEDTTFDAHFVGEVVRTMFSERCRYEAAAGGPALGTAQGGVTAGGVGV